MLDGRSNGSNVIAGDESPSSLSEANPSWSIEVAMMMKAMTRRK